MTSCPAGPQPRPSFWQRRWPRTSCTLMQALGQAFCSWWAARWVRGLFFSRSFSTFVASSQGASVLKWPVSLCLFFFTVPFLRPRHPKAVAAELWEVSVSPTSFSLGPGAGTGTWVTQPHPGRHGARVQKHRPLPRSSAAWLLCLLLACSPCP